MSYTHAHALHVLYIELCCAGYGGGFMERDEVVEYIERHDSDDEFDEVKFHCCRLEAVRVIYVAMSSPRTPYELLKSDLKLTFSLRHMKRCCHGAPLHFLSWHYTSFIIGVRTIIGSVSYRNRYRDYCIESYWLYLYRPILRASL